MLPWILTNEQAPTLRIEPPQDKWDQTDFDLHVVEHTYLNEFISADHLNFIGKGPSGPSVLSVMTKTEENKPNSYKALHTTSKGSSIFHIDVPGGNPVDEIQKFVATHPDYKELYLTQDPAFPTDFAGVEQKHCQKRNAMKIAVIYCKKGQTTNLQMFSNTTESCSPDFWKFMGLLGQKIDLEGWKNYRGDMRPPGTAWYDCWMGVEIIFHVAPILNAEEIRRLIGNDIQMLFYLEEDPGNDLKFDCSSIESFGEVPQVFAVIQPTKSDKTQEFLYRLAFFSKSNISSYCPKSPKKPVNLTLAKRILLTNLHNGLVQTTYCPPMNRLFSVPRRATLTEIIHKYPRGDPKKVGAWGRLAILNPNASRLATTTDSLLSLKKILLTTKFQFSNFSESQDYSHTNSLFFSMLCHMGSWGPEEFKKMPTLIPAFNCENLVHFKDKETSGFIYTDATRIFVIFRGDKNLEKLRSKGQSFEIKRHGLRFSGSVLQLHANAVRAIWSQIYDVLANIGTKRQLYFVGFGTGGALAHLTAHVFHSFNLHPINSIYTFGAPKLGDLAYCGLYNSVLGGITYRVVHTTDNAPQHPKEKEWGQVGIERALKSNDAVLVYSLDQYIESVASAYIHSKRTLKRVSSLPSLSDLAETLRLTNFATKPENPRDSAVMRQSTFALQNNSTRNVAGLDLACLPPMQEGTMENPQDSLHGLIDQLFATAPKKTRYALNATTFLPPPELTVVTNEIVVCLLLPRVPTAYLV